VSRCALPSSMPPGTEEHRPRPRTTMVPGHSHANHSRGSSRPPPCRCRAPTGPYRTERPGAQPPEPPITFTLPHWPRSSHHAGHGRGHTRSRSGREETHDQAGGQASTAPHA
jgi:hypothetical protein